GELCAGAPEPGQELEGALLGADGREGDRLLARLLDLLQRRVQRGPVGDRGRVDARLVQDLLVVVEGEGVRADGDAVRLAVQFAGGDEVLVEPVHLKAEVGHRGQHAGVRQRRDGRVVQQDDVGGVAFLARQERLVGEGGRVVGGALDGDARLLAAGADPLSPGGARVVLRVRVPPGVRAARGGGGGAALRRSGGAGGQGQDGGSEDRRPRGHRRTVHRLLQVLTLPLRACRTCGGSGAWC